MLTAFLLLFAIDSPAREDWLCTEASSQRRGDSIYSCGIGSGKDENTARLNAFDNSKREFTKICDASDDCKGHEISVKPERTACDENAGQVKCYRLIVFSIGEKAKNGTAKLVDVGLKKETPRRRLASHNTPEEKTDGDTLKLMKGLKKSQVIEIFGSPTSTSDYGTPTFDYNNKKYCLYLSCEISFDSRGRVYSWTGFKPKYTTELDDSPANAEAIELAKKGNWTESPPPEALRFRRVALWDVSTLKPKFGYMDVSIVQEAVVSGLFSFSKGQEVAVLSPDGQQGTIASEEVVEAFRQGYRFDSLNPTVTPPPKKSSEEKNISLWSKLFGD